MTKEELHVQERDVVVPGEILATGMGFLPSKGTYRRDEQIIAERVGLVSLDGKVIKLTPLCGAYYPKAGDVIVATVFDIMPNGWRVNTNCPYSAVLMLSEATTEFISRTADLTRYFDIGDVIMTKIVNVTSQNLVDITMKGPGLRKLFGGRIIKVDPQKVPRIIGKKASMVQMIKDATGCRIAVGQNGVIWIDGSPEAELVAVDAITQIAEKAHLSGLTDQIKTYLDKAAKDLPKVAPQEHDEENLEENVEAGEGRREGGFERSGERRFERGGDRGFAPRRFEGREGGYGERSFGPRRFEGGDRGFAPRRYEGGREGGYDRPADRGFAPRRFGEGRFERSEGGERGFGPRRYEGGNRYERREGGDRGFAPRRFEGEGAPRRFEGAEEAPRRFERREEGRRFEGAEEAPRAPAEPPRLERTGKRFERRSEEPSEPAPEAEATPKRKTTKRRGK